MNEKIQEKVNKLRDKWENTRKKYKSSLEFVSDIPERKKIKLVIAELEQCLCDLCNTFKEDN